MGAVIYLLTFTAVDIIAAIFVFFVLFAVGFEEGSGTGSIVLGSVLLTALLFMPIVVRLSRRFGKKRTYIGAMASWIVTMLVISMVPSGTTLTPLLIIAAVAGIGYSAANAIPGQLSQMSSRKMNGTQGNGAKAFTQATSSFSVN